MMWLYLAIAFVLGELLAIFVMATLSGRLDRWLYLREQKMNNKKGR